MPAARPRVLPRVLPLLTLAAVPAASFAQRYSNDFSAGPGDAAIYGSAQVVGGALRLTPNAFSQSGAIVLGTDAADVRAFEATFTYRFSGGGFNVADGLSFNLGVLPNGPLPGAAEEGPGNGLTVTFDTYAFEGGQEWQGGISVRRGGTVVASAPNALNPLDDWNLTRPVRIFLDHDGTIDVSYNGVLVVNNVQTGFVPAAAQRFGLASRTGAVNGEHTVDDLVVTPHYRQGSCAAPALIRGDGVFGFSYDTVASPTEGSASCATTNREVWFCWLAETDGTATVSTDGLSDDDSVLSVYRGCGACPASFGQIACNDDINGAANRRSRVSFRAEAGATYSIRVALFGTADAGASGLEAFSVTTAADPTFCAGDFNRSGGAPTVDDIFAFLSAWFAGCP